MRNRPSLRLQDRSHEGHTQNGALNCGMLTEGTGLPGSSSSVKRSSGAPVGSRRSSTVPSVCAVPQRPISSHNMRALRHQHSHVMRSRSGHGACRKASCKWRTWMTCALQTSASEASHAIKSCTCLIVILPLARNGNAKNSREWALTWLGSQGQQIWQWVGRTWGPRCPTAGTAHCRARSAAATCHSPCDCPYCPWPAGPCSRQRLPAGRPQLFPRGSLQRCCAGPHSQIAA